MRSGISAENRPSHLGGSNRLFDWTGFSHSSDPVAPIAAKREDPRLVTNYFALLNLAIDQRDIVPRELGYQTPPNAPVVSEWLIANHADRRYAGSAYVYAAAVREAMHAGPDISIGMAILTDAFAKEFFGDRFNHFGTGATPPTPDESREKIRSLIVRIVEGTRGVRKNTEKERLEKMLMTWAALPGNPAIHHLGSIAELFNPPAERFPEP